MNIKTLEEPMEPIVNATRYDTTQLNDAMSEMKIEPKSKISIVYINNSMSRKYGDIDAFVLDYTGMRYGIFIKSTLGDNTANKVLLHELTHIKQMQEGLLNQKSLSDVRWKGLVVNIATHPDRSKYPHEIDAHSRTRDIMKYLKEKNKKVKKPGK